MVRLPAVHAAGVAAAPWAVRRRGGGRQVDGEALEIKTGTDGAAPFGGTQDLERKQDEAPECSSRRVEMLTGCIFYDRASSKVRESPNTGELNNQKAPPRTAAQGAASFDP